MGLKVSFLINTLSKFGGTERVTSVIANALAEKGYEVEITCLFNRGESLYALDERVNIRYLLNRKQRNLWIDYLKIAVTLFRYRRQFEYIIAVGMDLFVILAPLKILCPKLRIVGWEHFNLTVKGPVVSLARHLGMKFGHRIVTITKSDYKEYLRKFIHKNKVTCIYNPVTLDNVKPLDHYGNRVVLCIGRFTAQKGFDMMLTIWSMLSVEYSDWRLIIVGEGQDEELLKNLIRKYDISHRVSLYPPTKEVLKYYYEASIYALPSRYEGLPLVLLESQATGLPVVAFNCETGPKEVISSGFNGFLIDPFNIEMFVLKLEELMSNISLREQMGRQSFINAKHFSVENIIKEWMDILK